MIQFIYGKNSYLIQQELKKIEGDFVKLDSSGINLEKLDGSSTTVSRIEQAISAMPFLADKRLVIVSNFLLDNKESEAKNQLCDLLQSKLQKKQDFADLVFVEDGEPDKRSRLYKFLFKNAECHESRALEGRELLQFVSNSFRHEGIEAQPERCQYLVTQAGNDMQKLEHEIIKLSLYIRSQGRKILEKTDIDLLVTSTIDPNVFDFTEAIARRDAKKASLLLGELLYTGENEQKLIGNIAYQFRTLIMIKDCLERGMNAQEIASKAKLAPFVVTKNLALARNKSMRSLIIMYESLRRTDSTIKSGAVTPDLALNIFVATLCAK